MASRTAYKLGKDKPVTLGQLLRKAAKVIWEGKTIYGFAVASVDDADEIMGRPMLEDINTEMVADYAQIISENLKPASVNRKLSSLHVLLKYAHDREWITKMPKFPWRTELNTRIRWVTPEEQKQLLELLPEDVAAFCEILIHTGMRRGELLNLRKENVDRGYARLWNTKTKVPRSVPLSPRAQELVEKWVPFTIHPQRIRYEWDKAKKAMGLAEDRHFVLHCLRHTAATRMLDTIHNPVVVQKLLGHSKIETTMRYAHVSDETLFDAVKKTSEKYAIS